MQEMQEQFPAPAAHGPETDQAIPHPDKVSDIFELSQYRLFDCVDKLTNIQISTLTPDRDLADNVFVFASVLANHEWQVLFMHELKTS